MELVRWAARNHVSYFRCPLCRVEVHEVVRDGGGRSVARHRVCQLVRQQSADDRAAAQERARQQQQQQQQRRQAQPQQLSLSCLECIMGIQLPVPGTMIPRGSISISYGMNCIYYVPGGASLQEELGTRNAVQ